MKNFGTIVAVIVALVFCAIRTVHVCGVSESAKTMGALAALKCSLEDYRSDYGRYPLGNNAAIYKALKGENPKKIEFLRLRPGALNAQGQIVDSWGTPYRIEIPEKGSPRISSAGKNRRFEPDSKDSDDIRSWSD